MSSALICLGLIVAGAGTLGVTSRRRQAMMLAGLALVALGACLTYLEGHGVL